MATHTHFANPWHTPGALLLALSAWSAQAATLSVGASGPGQVFGPLPDSGQTVQFSVDSALAGLALSNGTSNPFVAPATSKTLPVGAVGAFNVVKASVTGDAQVGVTSSEALVGGNYRFNERFTTVIQPQVSSVDFDGITGQLTSARLAGTVTIASPAVDGLAFGGNMALSDIRLDFSRGVVTADVLNNPDLPGFTVSAEDVAVFSFGQITGISGLSWQAAVNSLNTGDTSLLASQGWSIQDKQASPTDSLGLTGWLELANLKATDQFQSLIIDALGVPDQGTARNVLLAVNSPEYGSGWGTLRMGLGVRVSTPPLSGPLPVREQVSLNPAQMLQPVAAAVPEPSAAALMLIGLLGLGWKARTRAAQAGTSSGHPA